MWLLFAVVATEILITYTRLPPERLYNVSGSGFTGGASRVLVFANWPLALVAIGILGFLAERLAGCVATVVAIGGIVLCAGVFWPGMVKQSNLDARPANAIPSLGVLAALLLTMFAARRLARSSPPAWARWDRLRIALAVLLLVLAPPWLSADLGLSFDGEPVLGSIYQSGELRSEPPYPPDVAARPAQNPIPGAAATPDGVVLHPAVHHGHHHGMTGVLLAWSALLLSRLVPSVGRRRLRGLLAAYVALMFCYGAGVFANDFWLEQIVKRGWIDWSIPNVNNPTVGGGWGVILAAMLALWCVTVWLRRRPSRASTL
ncbi:MAG: hypothetical protein ABWY51_06645 [Gaiellaceae bacterium]